MPSVCRHSIHHVSQSSMLNDEDTPSGIKYTIWKAMKPLQFKIGISSRAVLPNTCLRMLRCRAAPVTADEFPDEDALPDSAWPKLQEDNAELRALWSDSVSVAPSERHSDSTGDFDWPNMPLPHLVQSQVLIGECQHCSGAAAHACLRQSAPWRRRYRLCSQIARGASSVVRTERHDVALAAAGYAKHGCPALGSVGHSRRRLVCDRN
jgi:hypothetical protein